MGKVENATAYAESIAKDNRHGYSQTNRWGNPDFDCSGLVITAYTQAGVNVKGNGATYTGNMYGSFKKAGFKDVTKTVNVKTGVGLKRGDVLLNPGHHTAIYCGNGQEVEASINENGKATGGKPGDQTGKEILIRSYRNYPWKYVLRFPEVTQTNTGKKVNATSIDEALTVIAKAVIAGKYGNGQSTRMVNIYNAVQAKVNAILKR